LPYDLAQEVNTLLESYMDKAGEGVIHETLADDFFGGKSVTVSDALDKIIAETEDKVVRRLAQLAKAKMGKASEMLIEYRGTESSLRGRYVQGVSVEHGGAIYIYQNATTGTDIDSARGSM
jgi:DNA gyrase/topoisomerase IV subunit A